MKTKPIIFFVILLILFVGVVSANDVSSDINTDQTTTDELSKDTSTVTEKLKERPVDNTDNDKNILKANTYDVRDFENLHSYLTSDDYDSLTINIYSNIQLKNNTNLNTAITDLTINGNGYEINGNNLYQFLNITIENKVLINNLTINNCKKNDVQFGGAILNRGNLTINNCSFKDNQANIYGGAIYNYDTGILIVNNSKFTNNQVTEYDTFGGAIFNNGTLTINNTQFTNNTAKHGGGAIFNFAYTTIEKTNFTNNSAYSYGGAIENFGTLTINNTQYNNNYVEDQSGGAIYNEYNLTINNSNFTNNSAYSYGGAIENEGNLNLTNSIFINNIIYGYSGGAIYNDEGKMILENNTFTNNTATYAGAIFNDGNTTIEKTNFTDNTALIDAGAIYNHDLLTINNCNFTNNSINNTNGGTGGAIYNTDGTLLTINNTQFTNNTINGNEASGAAIGNDGTLTINNTQFTNNQAKSVNGFGGAIMNFGYATIEKTNFTDNTAKHYGGAIYNDEEAEIDINNTNFTNNKVTDNDSCGGAIFNNHTLTLNNTQFTNNTATNGSAISNYGDASITNNTFRTNKANMLGKAIIDESGNAIIKDNINDETSKYYGTIYTDGEVVSIIRNIFDDESINTTITISSNNSNPNILDNIKLSFLLKDQNNNVLPNQTITVTIGDDTYTLNTSTSGIITKEYLLESNITHVTATYAGFESYNETTNTTDIIATMLKTTTVINSTTGIIGEPLTIKINVTDEKNNKVNGGNLILKVNGVTIKDNGKLTNSSNPLKVKVKNGIATAVIVPDSNMLKAENIVASYIGTRRYYASTSSSANMKVLPRNASIDISTNTNVTKQGQNLTITAKIYDTTNGKKNTNLTSYPNEYVYFKINGITIKDDNGDILKVKVVNGVATLNYTVPLGLSGVTDCKTMTAKNYTIIAGYYNKNYQSTSNTSTFQVERSNITLNIENTTINNKTHKLSLKVTIKDYLGNVIPGPNKFIIKINGFTIKNGTKKAYYYSIDGILTIDNIDIPVYTKYNNIEVVTQDRLAYNSQKNSTTKIKIVN